MGQGNVSSSSSGGIGFVGLLTILFIALKLTGVVTWSWVWVLAPLWISFALVLAVIVLFGIGFGIYLLVDSSNTKNKRRNLNGRR